MSFDDAFIEIKSQNIESVTKRIRLNLRMVTKPETDTAPEGTKPHHAYDMAIYTIAKAEVWRFEVCRKMGIKAGRDSGSMITGLSVCAAPKVDYDHGLIVVRDLSIRAL